MPIYQFRCTFCGHKHHINLSIDDYSKLDFPTCPDCHARMVRYYTPFTHRPSLQPHYNHALGKYVSGQRDLNDSFKSASEAATLRTGIEHRFVPHDVADPDMKAELGVTDLGLDSTYRKLREDGRTEGKKWL